MSGPAGLIHDPDGIRLILIKEIKRSRHGRSRECTESVPTVVYSDRYPGIWKLPRNIALLRTLRATALFLEAGVLFGPAKAANTGGVAVSGLEMSQNSIRLSWKFKEVNARLQESMKDIYPPYEAPTKCGKPANLLIVANAAGFLRLADTMLQHGF